MEPSQDEESGWKTPQNSVTAMGEAQGGLSGTQVQWMKSSSLPRGPWSSTPTPTLDLCSKSTPAWKTVRLLRAWLSKHLVGYKRAKAKYFQDSRATHKLVKDWGRDWVQNRTHPQIRVKSLVIQRVQDGGAKRWRCPCPTTLQKREKDPGFAIQVAWVGIPALPLFHYMEP